MKIPKYLWISGIAAVLSLAGACSSNNPRVPMLNQPTTLTATNSFVPVHTSSTHVGSGPSVSNNFPVVPPPTNAPQTNFVSTVASNVTVSTTNLEAQSGGEPKGQTTKTERMQAVWAAYNNLPQDIYGKVVDQYGQPVVGAKIQGNLTFIAGFEHTKEEIHYTETDSSGRFHFIGLHGYGLGIWPQKEGYDYDLKLPSARPDDYQPDSNNPVIFTMWKLKGAEPMVHVKAQAGVACDGSPVTFNLLTGKRDAQGDLTVRLTRNPVNIVRGKPFDWSITLEISNGGLQEITDLYPNEAPRDGYQSSITMNFPASMPKWSAWLDHPFYFKSRGGQVYGRMNVSITADFQPPPTFFSVEIYANPAGSRNLEFDPDKQIR